MYSHEDRRPTPPTPPSPPSSQIALFESIDGTPKLLAVELSGGTYAITYESRSSLEHVLRELSGESVYIANIDDGSTSGDLRDADVIIIIGNMKLTIASLHYKQSIESSIVTQGGKVDALFVNTSEDIKFHPSVGNLTKYSPAFLESIGKSSISSNTARGPPHEVASPAALNLMKWDSVNIWNNRQLLSTLFLKQSTDRLNLKATRRVVVIGRIDAISFGDMASNSVHNIELLDLAPGPEEVRKYREARASYDLARRYFESKYADPGRQDSRTRYDARPAM